MSQNIWDETNQKLIKTAGNVNLDDSVISEESTWSSSKINVNLGELDGKKATVVNVVGDYNVSDNESIKQALLVGIKDIPVGGTGFIVIKHESNISTGTATVTKPNDNNFVAVFTSYYLDTTRRFQYSNGGTWKVQELATMDKVVKRKTITVQTDSNGNIGLDVPVEKFVNAFVINQGELVRFLNVYTWANVAYGRVTDLGGNVIAGTHTVTILYNE